MQCELQQQQQLGAEPQSLKEEQDLCSALQVRASLLFSFSHLGCFAFQLCEFVPKRWTKTPLKVRSDVLRWATDCMRCFGTYWFSLYIRTRCSLERMTAQRWLCFRSNSWRSVWRNGSRSWASLSLTFKTMWSWWVLLPIDLYKQGLNITWISVSFLKSWITFVNGAALCSGTLMLTLLCKISGNLSVWWIICKAFTNWI